MLWDPPHGRKLSPVGIRLLHKSLNVPWPEKRDSILGFPSPSWVGRLKMLVMVSTCIWSLSSPHPLRVSPIFILFYSCPYFSGLIIFSKYLLSHGEHRKVEAICLAGPVQSLPLLIQQHLYFCPWFLLLHHMIFTAVALNSTPTVTVKIIPPFPLQPVKALSLL